MTPPVAAPNQENFANEVREDRLKTLWQFSLAGAIILSWIIATIGTLQRQNVTLWFGMLFSIVVGCLVARVLLNRNRFNGAVGAYAAGLMVGGGLMIMYGDATASALIPFFFPLLIFMIGLLVSPASTFLGTLITVMIIVIAPLINPAASFGWVQIFAAILTLLAALLSAQVTGELYQITEWAMQNYQRERKTTNALFENRELLEKSLQRSRALGEELQEANVALDSARQAAEEAKRFRGQFLANMSHELRTPLNAIIGFSETMLKFPAMYDGVGLPKAYEADLNQIYSSGRQLLSLINDILDLSKVDAGKLELHMQRVELQPIFDTAHSIAQGLIGEKPIKLISDLPEILPAVWADEARIRQVLLNLYSNAVKFTDQGSITLSLRDQDEGVRISLTDTGPGIDPLYHEAIFEEFKQANSLGRDPRAGAGLGLAISRHLMGLMGGRIWVESQPGKGSTFHMLIPGYLDDGTRPKRASSTQEIPLIVPKPKVDSAAEPVVSGVN